MRTVLMFSNDIIEREALTSYEKDQTRMFVQHHLRWFSESTKRGIKKELSRAQINALWPNIDDLDMHWLEHSADDVACTDPKLEGILKSVGLVG